ncbi:16S rRNA (cytidine1402-2'-O)-methyltransferase [Desulfitispora alkaliphila]|uniref:16S rRNA (cytidine(1402)-2'-O)-methyltransferase n=1 Tax=Desulfitispora alkaliphila TaxID=622674 RepID=UPI003D1FAA2D
MKKTEKGVLYLCATPIGNLEDMTFRAVRILDQVDLIAAEDTRHTIKLLNHYQIKNKLISYHEHNKISKGKEIIIKIKEGNNIALVTDAGLPGISDPGSDLVQQAVDEGIEVVAIPGASACTTSLVVSGLDTDRFMFVGFLPRNARERNAELQDLAEIKCTMIFYEAPHRIISTLKTIGEILPNRQMAIARELTKKYEEVVRGKPDELLEYFKMQKPKGEFALIVQGNKDEFNNLRDDSVNSLEPEFEVQRLIQEEGINKKDAIKRISADRQLKKRDVYQRVLALEEQLGEKL